MQLTELPKGDYAYTIARSFLFDAFHHALQQALTNSTDERLKGIAAKAVKEATTKGGGGAADVEPTAAYVDGNMVSAKGWTGLAAFMRECLNVLGTKITHS